MSVMALHQAIKSFNIIHCRDCKDDCVFCFYGIAKNAIGKQIPCKPITYAGTNRADCPECGSTVRGIKDPFGDYCNKCGQKLDWS